MATRATPWEIAKDILVQEIFSRRIPCTIGPKQVHGLCLEYKAVEYKNFRTSLNTLRKALYELKDKASVDNAAFEQSPMHHVGMVQGPTASQDWCQ
jgi:hypothetical protein